MAALTIMQGQHNQDEGRGAGFARIVVILAGVSALVACLLTVLTTYLQAKNYRKPLLQRHVIRILFMVPIYSAASWASLTSLKVAFWIEPFRDVYEAFTIYTFFQLLVNFLGGERSLIIMMHGRPPVPHLWPLNHVFPKVDISDPYTFLDIKRGILQYAYAKPILAIATIICKATGTFREGVLSVKSGYFWTGLIYNVSICWSLYDLALFWVCMSEDLKPFRPMPKFLCIKGIIFASYWQGFFLSILVFLGAIPSFGVYTPETMAAAIQNALICFEMPLFAMSHWYAFSWKDYVDNTISEARMPIRFALRDASGPRDLIEDAKETFSGKKYEYRYFDTIDNVMAHEQSASREARMRAGMRYERGGRGKYWVPSAGTKDAKQPLLSRLAGGSHARTMSPGGSSTRKWSPGNDRGYGTHEEPEEPELDAEEERLYTNARALEYGDWNYPVIATHFASHEDRVNRDPYMVTPSSNRALLQPTSENRERRKSKINEIREHVHQYDKPSTSSSEDKRGSSSSGGTFAKGKEKIKNLPVIGTLVRSSSSDSAKSANSQLVDLVVEDREARDIERVRARKEGGPGWNSVEQKHFVKTYPNENAAEEVREGFNPDRPEQKVTTDNHTLTDPLSLGDGDDEFNAVADEPGEDELGQQQPWSSKQYDEQHGSPFEEERNVWRDDNA